MVINRARKVEWWGQGVCPPGSRAWTNQDGLPNTGYVVGNNGVRSGRITLQSGQSCTSQHHNVHHSNMRSSAPMRRLERAALAVEPPHCAVHAVAARLAKTDHPLVAPTSPWLPVWDFVESQEHCHPAGCPGFAHHPYLWVAACACLPCAQSSHAMLPATSFIPASFISQPRRSGAYSAAPSLNPGNSIDNGRAAAHSRHI